MNLIGAAKMDSDASIGTGLRRAALAEVVETPIQKK
jgi:hypothetical protein